jgi:acetyl esterase/lipase
MLMVALCVGGIRLVGGSIRHANAIRPGSPPTLPRLRVDDTIGTLLGHPAFSGFGRLLLPWDDRRYDEKMRLRDVGSLLPYHTHVVPDVVVSSLNRLIADVERGRAVFYDIYSESDKRDEPGRKDTGLFFMRGTPGAPFAIVAPGGGFQYVGSIHEGFPFAAEISARGYNAFVLKYRVGQGGAVATRDMAAALAYVFRHASTLGVGTVGYSLWGSSAGARTAASIGSHGTEAFGAGRLPQPAAVVMAYTAHDDVGFSEPPTFAVVGDRDGIAPPSSMERRIEQLRRAGTLVEYRKYPGMGHGFGAGTGTSAEGWIHDAIAFWTARIPSSLVKS